MRNSKHLMDLLFTVALLGVFAVTALMVVIMGANVYKKTVERMDEGFALRTSISYISQKVRQNDVQNAVSIGEVEGAQALVLSQTVGGQVYQTWIYYDSGALREVFVKAGSEVKASDGQPIVELGGFVIAEAPNGMHTFTMIDNNQNELSVTVGQRSSQIKTGTGVPETELILS